MFGAILKATNSSFQKGTTFSSYHICDESYEATCIHI